MVQSRVVIACAALTACLAAQPRLIVDVNRQPGAPVSSSPARFAVLANGDVVFAATTLTSGTEPWLVSTSLGLRALGDLAPGVADSRPAAFAAYGGGALFTVATPGSGAEPWLLPRVGAPRRLADVRAGVVGSDASDYVVIGTNAFFFADDGVRGRELWFTDGTTAGTRLVLDIKPGAASSQANGMVPFSGGVAFVADDGQHGFELWVSDGSASGTRMVRDLNPGTAWGATGIVRPVVIGATLYFHGDDGVSGAELWRTDGTASGTVLVTDLVPGNAGSAPDALTALDGTRVMFAATVPLLGRELCVSDGTAGGTRVIDLAAGLDSSSPTQLAAAGNGRVFFAATTSATGVEPGVSDGSAAGSTLLDFTPGPNSTRVSALRATGGVAFVITGTGRVLRSDGTLAGTIQLAGDDGSRVRQPELAVVSPTLAYFAGNSAAGIELWVSDGTPAGTRLHSDIEPSQPTEDASPTLVGGIGGRTLFFATNNGVRQLYASDGSAPGTAPVVTGTGTGYRPQTVDLGDRALLPVATGGSTRLLATDGRQLASLLAVRVPSNMTAVALDANRAVFTGLIPGTPEAEPFITDGTDAGTLQLANLNGAAGSEPGQFTRVGRTVYFAATDGLIGNEVWRTDGTPAGTALVRDVQPSLRLVVTLLGAAGGYLIFGADDGVVGYELWRTDGTAAGTQRLIDLNPGTPSSTFYRDSAVELDGKLVFAALTRNGHQVFVTDGQSVTLLPMQPLVASALPFALARAGRHVIAMANPLRGDLTVELFSTDGTVAGTAPLSAPWPSGIPSALATAGTESVAFAIQPTGALTQVYRIDDGMPPRVVPLGGLATSLATQAIEPPAPMLVGGQFYLRGYDTLHGEELWSMPAGAIAQTEGLGCGSRSLGLDATTPRLNRVLDLRLDGRASLAVMWLGQPAPTPVRFTLGATGCALHVTLPLVTIALPSGVMSLAVPIPGDVNLLGSVVAAQAAVGPTATGIDVSNGVRLQLGF